jgi:hypothetical protein
VKLMYLKDGALAELPGVSTSGSLNETSERLRVYQWERWMRNERSGSRLTRAMT